MPPWDFVGLSSTEGRGGGVGGGDERAAKRCPGGTRGVGPCTSWGIVADSSSPSSAQGRRPEPPLLGGEPARKDTSWLLSSTARGTIQGSGPLFRVFEEKTQV